MVDERIINYAKSLGYDGAEYKGEWKEFDVYEPTLNEPADIGKPVFILNRGEQLFTTTEKEAFEYIDSLPDEE